MQPKFKRGGLSEDLLCSLLDHDVNKNRVVVSRGGKISRKHYSDIIGCTPSALSNYIHIFAEYEERLAVSTGPLRYLSDMKDWLDREYDAGRLEWRGGKLNRIRFMQRFHLKGGVALTRYEPIKRLFEEIEERARHDGYMSSDFRREYQAVEQALKGDLVINKDRRTINLVELARVVGISVGRLRSSSFSNLLKSRQDEISAGVSASLVDPYLHGRVFPFSDLVSKWPLLFIERVAVRFKQVFSTRSAGYAKLVYIELLNSLRWIGSSENGYCAAVVLDAKRGRVTSIDSWEEALFAYRSHCVAERGESAADAAINNVRSALEALESARIVPAISIRLPGVKNIHRKRGKLRSMAEISDQAPERDSYVDFARAQLRASAKASGLDLGKDGDQFIDGLSVELASRQSKGFDVAFAVRDALSQRLGALRKHAADIVEESMRARRRGKSLIERASIDAEEFDRLYRDKKLSSYERNRITGKYFPDPSRVGPEEAEIGLANLLALIDKCYGGIPPAGSGNKGEMGQFFSKRYLAYGGLKSIESLLLPDANTVGAVLTLYLCDSGANLSVGRTLDRECLESSDLEGYFRITGYKARAHGKPIIFDFPSTSPSVVAINWLREMGGALALAAKDDGDRLMLMRLGNRVQLMTPHWFTGWFKSFTESVPELSGIALNPSMIRPSVLLHASLSNDGRLGTGLALGQHGVAVSQGYQQKHSTRLLYDENIKRFQKAFETLVLSNVEDAAIRLGITALQFEARLGDLRATGLGTFCSNARGRPGSQSASCATVDCWNECPHMLIVAEVEAIAHLRLWQDSLRSVQPEWERDRPERWDAVWLPWLCLADVVQERMLRGSLITIWTQAGRRAAIIAGEPGYVPPRPW